jgi:hypothetical protein
VNKAIGLESKRKELGEQKCKFQSHGQSSSNTRPHFSSQQSPSQYRPGGQGGRYPQNLFGSCSTHFNHNASTLRQLEFLLLSRVVPTMALGHLSETLLLFSPMGASSVESWDIMPTTVLREQCRLLRGITITGLGSHLHRLILHRLLAREASRTMCMVRLIMFLWSKLFWRGIGYVSCQLYTHYSII